MMNGAIPQDTEIKQVIVLVRLDAGKKGELKLAGKSVDVVENTRSLKFRKGACVDVDENKQVKIGLCRC